MMSTVNNIINCMNCVQGEHLLFRGFGLNIVDRVGSLRRSDISEQLRKYYPEIRDFDLQRLGEGVYSLTVAGQTVGVGR